MARTLLALATVYCFFVESMTRVEGSSGGTVWEQGRALGFSWSPSKLKPILKVLLSGEGILSLPQQPTVSCREPTISRCVGKDRAQVSTGAALSATPTAKNRTGQIEEPVNKTSTSRLPPPIPIAIPKCLEELSSRPLSPPVVQPSKVSGLGTLKLLLDTKPSSYDPHLVSLPRSSSIDVNMSCDVAVPNSDHSFQPLQKITARLILDQLRGALAESNVIKKLHRRPIVKTEFNAECPEDTPSIERKISRGRSKITGHSSEDRLNDLLTTSYPIESIRSDDLTDFPVFDDWLSDIFKLSQKQISFPPESLSNLSFLEDWFSDIFTTGRIRKDFYSDQLPGASFPDDWSNYEMTTGHPEIDISLDSLPALPISVDWLNDTFRDHHQKKDSSSDAFSSTSFSGDGLNDTFINHQPKKDSPSEISYIEDRLTKLLSTADLNKEEFSLETFSGTPYYDSSSNELTTVHPIEDFPPDPLFDLNYTSLTDNPLKYFMTDPTYGFLCYDTVSNDRLTTVHSEIDFLSDDVSSLPFFDAISNETSTSPSEDFPSAVPSEPPFFSTTLNPSISTGHSIEHFASDPFFHFSCYDPDIPERTTTSVFDRLKEIAPLAFDHSTNGELSQAEKNTSDERFKKIYNEILPSRRPMEILDLPPDFLPIVPWPHLIYWSTFTERATRKDPFHLEVNMCEGGKENISDLSIDMYKDLSPSRSIMEALNSRGSLPALSWSHINDSSCLTFSVLERPSTPGLQIEKGIGIGGSWLKRTTSIPKTTSFDQITTSLQQTEKYATFEGATSTNRVGLLPFDLLNNHGADVIKRKTTSKSLESKTATLTIGNLPLDVFNTLAHVTDGRLNFSLITDGGSSYQADQHVASSSGPKTVASPSAETNSIKGTSSTTSSAYLKLPLAVLTVLFPTFSRGDLKILNDPLPPLPWPHSIDPTTVTS